jgi:uncharacterized cupredoxin-like copper-binding protein
MIMGGGNPATSTTEIIDMGSGTPAWQYGPNMTQARIEMNALILPNGKVLALGGSLNDEDTNTASLNADLYDPVSNTFSSAGANAYPRLYHSVALLLPDATVWLAGGNPSRGSYVRQMEIYKPAYLFNPDGTLATRPSITSAPASVSYGESFNLTTPDIIASVVLVRNGTVTHAFGMDQREVGLSFTAGSGSLTVTAPPNGNIAPPGYYMLFLLNQSGVPSVASFIQITNAPPTSDFSVTATPSSQNVAPGKSTSYTVNVTPSGGFTGSVSFSVAGLPSGATSSFAPSSVSGSGSSTMTVSASSSTPAGTYPLTITATSGSLTHTAQVNLTVATTPDFSVTATPSSQNLAPGKSTSYTVNVTPSGGFTGSVSFSVAGLPSGATSSFAPGSVSGSGSSTLTVNASTSTAAGTYPLTITATSGTLTHTAQVKLTVADFSISVSPSSQTLKATGNSKATYTVTISALGPFSANTTFRVNGLPARTSSSFSPSTVPGKGTSTLTISAKQRAPSGTYPLMVSATGGGLTHSATVSLIVQ